MEISEEQRLQIRDLLNKISVSGVYDAASYAQDLARLTKEIKESSILPQSFEEIIAEQKKLHD